MKKETRYNYDVHYTEGWLSACKDFPFHGMALSFTCIIAGIITYLRWADFATGTFIDSPNTQRI